MSTRPLRNLDIPDYDSRQPSDILTLIYLFGWSGYWSSKSIKRDWNDESVRITVDSTDNNNDWHIPQVNATGKNGQQINEELGKAVNAAISFKTSKESMVK